MLSSSDPPSSNGAGAGAGGSSKHQAEATAADDDESDDGQGPTKRVRKMSNADAILDEAAAAADRRKRRRALFGDCALVEIIHLHDCLRGALFALQRDVNDLSTTLSEQRIDPNAPNTKTSSTCTSCSSSSTLASSSAANDAATTSVDDDKIADIERRVAGRFKVIWSVFQAHSAAEDEFIWPALQKKQADIMEGGSGDDAAAAAAAAAAAPAVAVADPKGHNHGADAANAAPAGGADQAVASAAIIEQEEYEEDHANEERMFESMDTLLTRLRAGLSEQRKRSSLVATSERSQSAINGGGGTNAAAATSSSSSSTVPLDDPDIEVHKMAQRIDETTHHLTEHLMAHLDKEETHCMPLVVKHLNKDEIHDLVGQIMGKRSADQMGDIMTMAVQNLNEADRDEMVRYMKQAMVGTFFERWLTMSGWMSSGEEKKKNNISGADVSTSNSRADACADADDSKPAAKTNEEVGASSEEKPNSKHGIPQTCPFEEGIEASSPSALCSMCSAAGRCLGQDEGGATALGRDGSATSKVSGATTTVPSGDTFDDAPPAITTPQELEKLIRAVASNQELSAAQKSTTIQGLRDSVWKSQVEHKRRLQEMNEVSTASAPAARGSRRVTPPSSYWKRKSDGTIELVWSSDSPNARFPPDDHSIPLFSASELAPSYFDGANSAVLGCPHYARGCKLRHPNSGRLYTCRLCCEQEREMPMKDQDSPLDRYEVSEILCMTCGALQPVGEKCCNPKCEMGGKAFAKWYCKICHLYDDSPTKKIYHCPFCNVCRAGRGLGIDYRHCMRCNACVSLSEKHTREHSCIPQRLQGNCPICHESMFQSTEPLRGLKCGHVMHLSCFSMYLRGGQWTCPLCKKSVEDMSEYFAMLDAAVRMQPMPAAYAGTMSNVYCQDCGKTGTAPYHFVGIKCGTCGSYNTRELGRGEGRM